MWSRLGVARIARDANIKLRQFRCNTTQIRIVCVHREAAIVALSLAHNQVVAHTAHALPLSLQMVQVVVRLHINSLRWLLSLVGSSLLEL